METTDLTKFLNPEPEASIKNQPLKLAGLVCLLALTAPLWVLVFVVAFPLAYVADKVSSLWREPEPERALKYSFHTTMPDGSTAHFQMTGLPTRIRAEGLPPD